MSNNNTTVSAEKKMVQVESRSPYEKLSNYITTVQQAVMTNYKTDDLTRHFNAYNSNDINTQTIATQILAVGIKYKPAQFILTGLEISQSANMDEIVFKIEYKHQDETKSLFLHSETYPDGRRYIVFNVIQDILSQIQEEIDELLPKEYDEVETYEIHDDDKKTHNN